MNERFKLEAGRLIVDTETGDKFNLVGARVVQTGALCYDPSRLDALARCIVDMLNAAETKPIDYHVVGVGK